MRYPSDGPLRLMLARARLARWRRIRRARLRNASWVVRFVLRRAIAKRA